ncbi:OB-fold nucleic acid binding domain-containing protein [Thermasporomyces composti]|jgi:RecG-like helicase|uniref:ATP-dependent DNA helicase RecG n=1 Tax=Thermasporomyces composti TaxID=696763 RepID=A0A3D9V8R9_THECX|nr:OB-fold nucleic acid binding domain-containing protein [Thermasporomyces composti]REF38162.1 ATP-dependent DNA helicase RecG [Thermasporomyces composti]
MSDRKGATRRGGVLRRALSRLTSSEDALEAEELQDEVRESGYRSIAQCADRERVRVCGEVRCITLRPRAGVPALEADLYDGSGTIVLVWLGRRRIAGIEPGRRLVAEGRVSIHQQRWVMYNPKYQLKPLGDDE